MLPRILNLVFNVLPVQQGSQDFSRHREIPRTVDDWKNLVMANMHTLVRLGVVRFSRRLLFLRRRHGKQRRSISSAATHRLQLQ